jgi:hypothetical protein
VSCTAHARALIGLLAGVCAALLATAGAWAQAPCPATAIRVTASDATDRDTVCRGAAAASAFLLSHGIASGHAVEVSVQERLPEGLPPTVLGCCTADGRRVFILDYATYATRQGFLFDLPPDRDLYAGAAAHEITHALVAPAFRIQPPSVAGQEYIAFVAMIVALPDHHRATLLALFPERGLDLENGSARGLLMWSPMHFGVEAYRHYARQQDPGAFLRRVLSGDALGD